MRFFSTIILCVLLTHSANAYWQQKVDHKIRVTLDDNSHILRGFQEMVYTNNSPDTLEYIFMHLYPNAYKHDHTAYAKQKVENGETKFYFSDKYEKGFIDSLSFKANNLPLNYSKYNDNEDVVFLELVESLLPGQSVTIETPFRVVIPKTFSRLGHVGQSYQITQWYPKPAVYDRDGWHMMPYLDQGEFFYEYGDYDVEITLPKNYVVASTGDLQTASEIAFRETKVSKNSEQDKNTEPQKSKTITIKQINNKTEPTVQIASSNESKTIRFTQKAVHDFAWFADKSFKIKKKEFQLPSGKKCTALAYFTPANKSKYSSSALALAETTKFLSKEVGEYPYNQISVVDGPLYAGGGMEYPNIAIIGTMPNDIMVNLVLVHEAGHNWFQGILGSNERVHPWLDEGVNSFYEAKVVEHLRKMKIPVAPSGHNDIMYQLAGHIHQDQPIELPSEEYTNSNYGGVVYAKAAKSMAYLEDYMGREPFQLGMKEYFKTWKQKHPGPIDLRAALEKHSNQNIGWFFTDYIQNKNPMDYIVESVRTQGANTVVRVKDKNGSNYPMPVFAKRGDSIIEKAYTVNSEALLMNYGSDVHYVLDEQKVVPEINHNNNSYQPKSLFKRNGMPKLGIGTTFLKPGVNKAYLMPAFGFNNYDRTMAGLVLHNLALPNKKFQFAVAPMYSFRSKRINGTGVVGYSFYPKRNFYRVTASLRGATFSADSTIRNIPNAIYPRWYKLNPRMDFELPRPSLRSPVSRKVVLNYFHTGTQKFEFNQDPTDSLFKASIGSYEKQNLFRVNYIHKNDRTFNPFSYNFQYETTRDISKLSAEGNMKIDYFMPKKAFYIRVFAGKFFYLNDETSFFDVEPYFLNVTPTAQNDYAYENVFFGRNEQSGYSSQQVMHKEGGFATRTTFLNNPLGQTDDWLVSVNLRSDIPLKYKWLPQLFFNAASFANAGNLNPSGNKMLFEGGLQFNLIQDIIRVNIPLVLSKDFKDYTKSIYSKNRFTRQISFSISTDKLDFLRTQDALTGLVF